MVKVFNWGSEIITTGLFAKLGVSSEIEKKWAGGKKGYNIENPASHEWGQYQKGEDEETYTIVGIATHEEFTGYECLIYSEKYDEYYVFWAEDLTYIMPSYEFDSALFKI